MIRAVAAFIYLFVFAAELQAQEVPYYNPATGGYYQTAYEACVEAIPDLQSFFSSEDTKGRSVTYTLASAGSPCRYNYIRSDGLAGQTAAGTSLGFSYASQLPACEAGVEKTISWPFARRLSDGSYQSFSGTAPLDSCFSGCAADYKGFPPEPPYSYPDSDGPDIVYTSVTYETTGGTCSSGSANPPMPPIPPPPTDGEDSGDDTGGSTGGGDTGGDTGGSAGGGDTGGDTGGSTGGDTGGSTGGGGGSGGSGGGSSGIPIDPPDDGLPDDLGDPGGSTGGDTGGSTGGDTGGSAGGDTGGSTGGSTGGDDGAGNSAGGLACNQPLTCEGDPVQCAILRTQKEQLCSDLDGADFEGRKGEIESLFSGPDFQREADEEVTVPSFVTGITRFFPSNSCPADASVSLSSFGGRTLKFTYEPICSFATALGPLIVIAATVFAALYVGRAFGGE